MHVHRHTLSNTEVVRICNFCRGGYKTFFSKLAQIETSHGTTIHLNSRVNRIIPMGRKLLISVEAPGWVHGMYDGVVVATRPKQVRFVVFVNTSGRVLET